MFSKILIVEDIDSISLGVTTLLHANFNASIHSSKYCDEALLKLKKAYNENDPFDLVVTDLSFQDSNRETKISTGEDLIYQIKKEQPFIRVIAYSVDDKPFRIKSLFDTYRVDGFVAKGRESVTELIEAVNHIYSTGEKYISPQLNYILKDFSHRIDEDDIELLVCLSKGMTQAEISDTFRNQLKKTSSTSSIEKRLNKLKMNFKANNTIHLISIAKDMGLI